MYKYTDFRSLLKDEHEFLMGLKVITAASLLTIIFSPMVFAVMFLGIFLRQQYDEYPNRNLQIAAVIAGSICGLLQYLITGILYTNDHEVGTAMIIFEAFLMSYCTVEFFGFERAKKRLREQEAY